MIKEVGMSVIVAEVKLRSPVVAASCTFGYEVEFEELIAKEGVWGG